MNKNVKTGFFALFCLCPFISLAETPLDKINTQVDAKAAHIDQTYGVLLTGQERNNLKINLVASQVQLNIQNDKQLDVMQAINAAIITYDISDPSDQRRLFIDIESQSRSAGNGDGFKPPCCE